MPQGYCPHCQQNVMLVRDEIDVCLAIILLIFTAGIGLVIYLAIHYSRPENKCIHCGTVISYVDTQQYAQQQYQARPQMQTQPQVSPIETGKHFEEVIKYCTFCGEKISFETKYCPNCGSKI